MRAMRKVTRRKKNFQIHGFRNRWLQLSIGILCMIMIANLQYSWTLFVEPLHLEFGWSRAEIQIAFTIFVLAETWLIPLEGYFIDLFGPQLLVFFGGVLIGAAWLLNSDLHSLSELYFAQLLGGVGAGAVYGSCISGALKWFPDHRGLAAGLTAAGFGMGSALTIVPISAFLTTRGYRETFLCFGLAQSIVVCSAAFFLSSPHAVFENDIPGDESGTDRRHFMPAEIIRNRVFWVLYAMFVMVASGGLMATAQLASISKDFGISDIPVNALGLSLPALTFALSIDRLLNGVTRPLFGWISDIAGREKTMFIAFGLEGIAILALAEFGRTPGMFVILSGLVFFAWGEIYSLFPAICADTFGEKYAATNSGLLYTAKGTAALLVPLSSILAAAQGWQLVFYVAAAFNFITALLAIIILLPLRRRNKR